MAVKMDLWGEIAPDLVRTPVAIMREQAALLGAKTKNLVEAAVKTDVWGQQLVHRFLLVAPTLSNYTYELFKVRHGAGVYPVTVLNESDKPQALSITVEGEELATENEFTRWLGAQLSSDRTKRIVANLLAQVTQ
jgi:hypothetical protein